MLPLLSVPRRLHSSPRRRSSRVRPLRLELLESRQLLTTFQVTTELDIVNPTDAFTSLREAANQANLLPLGPDEITFAAALADLPLLVNGAIVISDSVTIEGLGASHTTIDAQNTSNLFFIPAIANVNVTLDGMTLTRGQTTGSSDGGAICSLSTGQLTIVNSVISASSTAGTNSQGGGVFAAGRLTIIDSTITGNFTTGEGGAGGGIYAGGALTITGSTVSGNSTLAQQSPGGGIYGHGSAVDVLNSTISDNSTGGDSSSGGGMVADNSLTVTNSTISGNFTGGSFSSGGGIFAFNSTLIVNSTIAGNHTDGASAGAAGLAANLGPLTIRNSIIATNVDADGGAHPDLYPFNLLTPTVQHSLIGDNNGSTLDPAPLGSPDGNGNLIGTHAVLIAPLLGSLADNGGPTKTRRLLFGSPAIDAGENGLAVDPVGMSALTTDQCGRERKTAGVTGGAATVDMGAFEAELPPFIGKFGNAITYLENAVPQLISAAATVTDPDSADFADGVLTVALTAGAAAQDRLVIATLGSIATNVAGEVLFAGAKFGTFSGGSGVTPLTILFTSAATPAKAQALLRTITFRTLGDAPNAAPRTVRCQVTDGDSGTSNAVTKQITVTPVNDAPVLNTSVPVTLNAVAEDTTNPAGTLVSSLVAGVSDVDAGALQGVAVSGVSNNGGLWQYTLNGTTWLNFGGPTLSAARLLAADASTRIRFKPNANFNGASTLYLFAWDRTQGAAGATANLSTTGTTGGTTAFSSAIVQGSISVTPVNDAPVLNTIVPVNLNPVAEDTVSPAGTLVSALVGGVTDVDAGAVQGIAVSSVNGFTGTWQYTLNGTNWLNFGAVSKDAVRLLRADTTTRVRMIPNTNFNGTSSLWFFAWDRTQGSAGNTANLSPAGTTGGTTAFSNAAKQALLNVTPVNDAPVLGLSGSVGYALGSPAVVLAPASTVTDIDSSNFDTGELRVQITTGASAANVLELSGFTIGPGNAVLQGTTQIGTRTSNGVGTSELRITFNANATVAVVQQLVRSVTFRATSTTGSRTLLFSISDGDGELSDVCTKTVNVT